MSVEDFFVVRLLNSFSISNKETSLNKNGAVARNAFLIVKILRIFLYLSDSYTWKLLYLLKLHLRCLLVMNFQLCWKCWCHFEKKLFNSSDSNLSSDIIFSLSPTSVILLALLRFLEAIGWLFFQNVLLSVMFDNLWLFENVFCSFLYNKNFFCFLYFFKDSGVLVLIFGLQIWSSRNCFLYGLYDIRRMISP